MKRITIWITATVAVVALLVAFQVNNTASEGKPGESDQRPATEQTDDGGKSEGDTNDQTDKPGEVK